MTLQLLADSGFRIEQTALINVHWQNDLASAAGAMGALFSPSITRHNVVGKAADAISLFRNAGGTVVYARTAYRAGYPELIPNAPLFEQVRAAGCLVDGTWGARILDELAPQPGDHIISHSRISAFQGTELDLLLRALGITSVIFTGVATNITVEGTARDAVGLGYRAAIVSDACAAASDSAHQATLETFGLLGYTLTSDQLASFATRSELALHDI